MSPVTAAAVLAPPTATDELSLESLLLPHAVSASASAAVAAIRILFLFMLVGAFLVVELFWLVGREWNYLMPENWMELTTRRPKMTNRMMIGRAASRVMAIRPGQSGEPPGVCDRKTPSATVSGCAA